MWKDINLRNHKGCRNSQSISLINVIGVLSRFQINIGG